MSSGAKRNRDISGFSGRLRFLAALGMTLGLGEIFNAQVLIIALLYEAVLWLAALSALLIQGMN